MTLTRRPRRSAEEIQREDNDTAQLWSRRLETLHAQWGVSLTPEAASELLSITPGMKDVFDQWLTSYQNIQGGLSTRERERWEALDTDVLFELWMVHAAVLSGIDRIAPRSGLNPVTRRWLYWLTLWLRARIKGRWPHSMLVLPRAASNERAMVEVLQAMVYELIGPSVVREITRRGKQQIGFEAGKIALFHRALRRHGCKAEADPLLLRHIDQSFEALRKCAWKYVRSVPSPSMLRTQKGRLIPDMKKEDLVDELTSQIGLCVSDQAAATHPLDVLARSIQGRENLLPKKAGQAVVKDAMRRNQWMAEHLWRHPTPEESDSEEEGAEPLERREATIYRTIQRPDEALNEREAAERLTRDLANFDTSAALDRPNAPEGEHAVKAIAIQLGRTPQRVNQNKAAARKTLGVSKPLAKRTRRDWRRQARRT